MDLAARTLLDQMQPLQRLSDLDVLVFCARHRRTLLTTDELARRLGYDAEQIARSIEVLVAAHWLTRAARQNQERSVRMYVVAADHLMEGGPLPALVDLASTREGRLRLRLALTEPPGSGPATAGRSNGGVELPPQRRSINEYSPGTSGRVAHRAGGTGR